jgi:hypothetical protein
MHIENNAVAQDFGHLVDEAYRRSKIQEFTALLRKIKLPSVASALSAYLASLKEEDYFKFVFRLIGPQVMQVYKHLPDLFGLVRFVFSFSFFFPSSLKGKVFVC